MKRQVLTVGFTDLTRFHEAMERYGAETTVRALQASFEAVGDCIVKRGGVIRKYIGDTVLFTFEDGASAEEAAREIESLPPVHIGAISLENRVGLATGEVLIVTVGHSSYRVEDVYGSAVNRAALMVRSSGR